MATTTEQPDARITLELYGDPVPALRRLAEMLIAVTAEDRPEVAAKPAEVPA